MTKAKAIEILMGRVNLLKESYAWEEASYLLRMVAKTASDLAEIIDRQQARELKGE